ncbi:MAG TPA: hypothetical protein VK149_01165 [Sideroxyarcus sp.]|nr:hypothetical protein [Sideroxyarcus sp.]
MDIVEMDTNECSIEHDLLMVADYGEEVAYAEWNPHITLIDDESLAAHLSRHTDLPDDQADVDMDDFIKSMYEHQY